jgi:DDE domain
VDETYIRVKGKWVYLYRAVDSSGATIDFLLSAKRDAAAAERFLTKALRGFDIFCSESLETNCQIDFLSTLDHSVFTQGVRKIIPFPKASGMSSHFAASLRCMSVRLWVLEESQNSELSSVLKEGGHKLRGKAGENSLF